MIWQTFYGREAQRPPVRMFFPRDIFRPLCDKYIAFAARCQFLGIIAYARPADRPLFVKKDEKFSIKKSLQVAWNCAIIQKLEYAGSRGRLHALKRRVTTGQAETSSLTKRGRQGRAGAWDALRSLYVDASNFKSPFGSREHITWRCNHTWHVLRA